MSPENNISKTPVTRLPVTKILLGALALSWFQKQKLLHGLGGTALLIIAIQLGWHFIQAGMGGIAALGFTLVSMLLHTKYAVICHRLILVEYDSKPKTIFPFSWSDRESRFFGWMISIYFLVSIASVIIIVIPFSLFSQSLPEATRNDPNQLLPYAIVFIAPLVTWLLARLSPIFPAIATDRQENLSWAWKLTRSNNLQMMVIVGLLPWISGITGYLLVGNQPGWASILVANVIKFMLLTVDVVALSLAYRELVGKPGPVSA